MDDQRTNRKGGAVTILKSPLRTTLFALGCLLVALPLFGMPEDEVVAVAFWLGGGALIGAAVTGPSKHPYRGPIVGLAVQAILLALLLILFANAGGGG